MKKIYFASIVIFLLFITLPTIAFAGAKGSASGGNSGSDSGGGSGYYRTPIRWEIHTNINSDTVIRDTHSHPVDAYRIGKSESVAYTTTKTYQKPAGNPISFPNNWYRWKHWIAEGNGQPDEGINPLLWDDNEERYALPSNFINEVKSTKFNHEVQRGQLYKSSGGDFADMVWMDQYYNKDKENKNGVVIKFDHPTDPSESFDYTNKSSKWLYHNAPHSVDFSYKSKEGEKRFRHLIKATTTKVTKKVTWEENSAGDIKNKKITYRSSNRHSGHTRARWTADIPNVEYTPYKPFNLNTKNTMTDELWTSLKNKYGLEYRDSDFSGKIPRHHIDGYRGDQNLSNYEKANREKNPVDQDSVLGKKSVDINKPVTFNYKPENNQFGIPNESEGGINITENIPNYSNSEVEKQYYWDPDLHISSAIVPNNPPVTSLQIYGEDREYEGVEEIKYGYGWNGAKFLYRSIKSGEYVLGYDGKPFFITSLETGEFYDYGAYYEGRVSYSRSGPSFSPGGSKIPVDDKDYYHDLESISVEQPMLFGKFNVGSSGGYKKYD